MGLKLPTSGYVGETYNVALDLAFVVEGCRDEWGDTLTPQKLREAVLYRLASADDSELKEAVGFCDSFEEARTDRLNED